jgi:hypothetical protein
MGQKVRLHVQICVGASYRQRWKEDLYSLAVALVQGYNYSSVYIRLYSERGVFHVLPDKWYSVN